METAKLPVVPPYDFDGETYEPAQDRVRLTGQLLNVFMCMRDGKWRTLAEIEAEIETGTQASISARLRDLRKQRFGAFTVERQRRGTGRLGLFEYRLLIPEPRQMPLIFDLQGERK